MKSRILLLAGMMMWVGAALPQTVVAQDDEGPGSRIVTVTTWDVPYGEDRGVFMDWFREWFLPGAQINPNVLNLRVMFHQWGSNGDQIVMVSEYDSMETLAAGCGQPCADYNEENPAPEEGEEGYEEFQRGLELFQKYYSHHKDEIYGVPMGMAKVEGEVMGPIGSGDAEAD